MKIIKNNIKIFIVTFFILTASLIIISAIPNKYIINHQSEALQILNDEESKNHYNYPRYFFDTPNAQHDTYTEKIILQHAINDENDNILVSAMHKTYARYWHGYCIYMRPLLIFFIFYQIRYLLMIFYYILFGITVIIIYKKIDFPSAVAFILSISMCYMFMISTSLNFQPVFVFSYIAIILILSSYEIIDNNISTLFMVVGMITSFFDFLTAPLITLGLPLIIYILKNNNENIEKWYFKTIVSNSLCWGIGYGLFWSLKWFVASLILKENVLIDAGQSIYFRTMGDDELPGDLLEDRINAIRINFQTMFYSEGKLPVLLFITFLAILIIIAMLHPTGDRTRKLQFLSLILIGIFPIIWYFVLSNHSLIHRFFTYRDLSIFIFAITAGIERMIEWDELKLFNFIKNESN